LAFLFTTLAGPAVGSPDGPTTATLGLGRFGFVDVELVLAESRAIRAIVSEVDEDLAGREGTIREKRRELQKLRLALETQGPILSQPERDRRQQQAIALLSEIDELEFRFDRDMRRKQAQVIEPMLEQVLRVVGDVGQRDGFALIVRGETVLWGARSVDLTPVVVQELDRDVERLRAAVRRFTPEAAPEGTTRSAPSAAGSSAPLLPLLP
jgi:outer membrane protein